MDLRTTILANPILWYLLFIKDITASGLFMHALLGTNIKMKNLSLYIIVSTSIFFAIRILAPVSYSFLIITFLMIPFTMLFLKFNFLKSLLGVFLFQIVSVIGDYIIWLFYNILGITKETYTSNLSYMVYGSILGFIFLIVVTVFLYYSKLKIIIEEDIIKKRRIGLILNVIITLLLVTPNFIFFFSSSYEMPKGIIIFNILSLIVLFWLCTYNTYKNNELEMKKNELEYQKIYNKTLNELVDGLKTFKHDFANTLNSISGYISSNDLAGLKIYFNELYEDYVSVNTLNMVNSTIINNPSIYGIVVSKLNSASSKGIKTNIDITTDLNDSSLKIYELCKMLGILLDNAIEASYQSKNKQLTISMKYDTISSNYIITISNSFEGNINLNDIFKKGYSSKGENRGLGLWEVRNMTNKYKSVSIKTSTKDNIFIQELYIEAISLKKVV